MDLNITVGTHVQRVLLPEVAGVRARITDIKPNKYNDEQPPDRPKRVDFEFTLMDTGYDNDANDEEDNALIRELSETEYKHFQSFPLPKPGDKLGKGTDLFKLMCGLDGVKDIDTGEGIDLMQYLTRDCLLTFGHVPQKGGPPTFTPKVDDNGVPIMKAVVTKARPYKKARTAKPAQQVQVALDDEDSDLYTE